MQSHPWDHTLFLASKESLLLTNWLEGVIPATYMSDGLLVQRSWGKHSVVCHGQVSNGYFAEPEPMLLQSCSSFLLFPIKIELVLWLRSEPSSSAFVFGGKCCCARCALRPKRTAVCKVIRHQVCIACFIIISSSWRLCGFDCYTENHQQKRATAFTAVVGTLFPSRYITGSTTSIALYSSSPHRTTSPPWNTALLCFSCLFYHSWVWILWSLQCRLQSNCL